MLESAESVSTQTSFFGNTLFNITGNSKIIHATISFIVLTKSLMNHFLKQSQFDYYFSLFWLDHNTFFRTLDHSYFFNPRHPKYVSTWRRSSFYFFQILRNYIVHIKNIFFFVAHFLKLNFFKIKPVSHSQDSSLRLTFLLMSGFIGVKVLFIIGWTRSFLTGIFCFYSFFLYLMLLKNLIVWYILTSLENSSVWITLVIPTCGLLFAWEIWQEILKSKKCIWILLNTWGPSSVS